MVKKSKVLNEPIGSDIEKEDEGIDLPNKVSLQYGTIAVAIESQDKDTNETCQAAIECMNYLLGISQQKQIEIAEKELEKPIDLDSQKEYEKLMEGIK